MGRLARWRGGRLLHPRGLSFTGRAQLWGPLAARMVGGAESTSGGADPTPGGADPTPGGGDRYAATVRFSRGTPTPDGWPDVLGVAVRLHGAAGPFDLLLSGTSQRPVLRHLPMPRYDFAGPYGSLLAYRFDGRRVYVVARSEQSLGRTLDEVAEAAGRSAVRLTLLAAGVTGPWRPFGRVVLGTRLPAEVDAALAFDPDGRRGNDLRPTGLLQRLRTAGYAASQRERAAAEDQSVLP